MQQEEQDVETGQRCVNEYMDRYRAFADQLTTLLRLSFVVSEHNSTSGGGGGGNSPDAIEEQITDIVWTLRHQIPAVYTDLMALAPPLVLTTAAHRDRAGSDETSPQPANFATGL